MANVIGSGSLLFGFSSASAVPPAATLTANPPWSVEEPRRGALSPETTALLARVTELLEPHVGGLALSSIREALGAPVQEIRGAIDAGLRSRLVRRVGAGSTLRYVLNPRD